jgi:hypothetical protein
MMAVKTPSVSAQLKLAKDRLTANLMLEAMVSRSASAPTERTMASRSVGLVEAMRLRKDMIPVVFWKFAPDLNI